jgi:hypothetical protein
VSGLLLPQNFNIMEDFLDDGLSLFRIRSARRRKRARKDDYDKMLLRLDREHTALDREIRSLGWVELKPPIQRGFKRLFVLRDDVRRSKQAAFFENILRKINTTQWSNERTFRRKRKRFGKKVYTVLEQNLRDIEPLEFEKKFSEKEKLYFYPTLTHSRQSKKPYTVYRFVEPWRFVLRVLPDMITKVRIKDLDLEKESDRLWKIITHPIHGSRLDKLKTGATYRYRCLPSPKYKNPLHNRTFHDILDEYWPKPTMTISIRNPRNNEGFLFVFTVICRRKACCIFRRICPALRRKYPRTKKSFRSTFRKRIHYGCSNYNRSERKKGISERTQECLRYI